MRSNTGDVHKRNTGLVARSAVRRMSRVAPEEAGSFSQGGVLPPCSLHSCSPPFSFHSDIPLFLHSWLSSQCFYVNTDPGPWFWTPGGSAKCSVLNFQDLFLGFITVSVVSHCSILAGGSLLVPGSSQTSPGPCDILLVFSGPGKTAAPP